MSAGSPDDEDSQPTPAIRKRSSLTEAVPVDDDGGNIAGTLDADQPLEPQEIDLENALFVFLGVSAVVGLLVLAILGI